MACRSQIQLDSSQLVCDNSVTVEFWWTARSKRIKRTFEGDPEGVDALIKAYTDEGYILLSQSQL